MDELLLLPTAVLEVCVLLGASREKAREARQLAQQKDARTVPLEPEILSVFVPPFISKEDLQALPLNSNALNKAKRRSFRKKKEKFKTEDAKALNGAPKTPEDEDITIPKDAFFFLSFCFFTGGFYITCESREDHFHFLVFTDVFGNRTYGVVVQYYQTIQEGRLYNGQARWDNLPHSIADSYFVPFAVCVISRYPYFNALKDCLSCLLLRLKPYKDLEIEQHLKEFAARLSLVPSPPPGQLHLIITCILTERKIVFFCSDWALLTLEADDLILINIDTGDIAQSKSSEEVTDIPDVPAEAGRVFITRSESLQLHYDLELSHLGTSTDFTEIQGRRRTWQRKLNSEIQQIALQFVVNIFREVKDHLNYEHRVFNSEEFLKTRAINDQLFYRKYMLSRRMGMSLPNLHDIKLNDGPTRNASLRSINTTQDIRIFPTELVRKLIENLPPLDRSQADQKPELKRLISHLMDKQREVIKTDDHVKKFELPKTHMQVEDFVKRIQESGIVKDTDTIHRLFDALTVGQQKQIDPETFKDFYTYWKETEAEAQDVNLPPRVIEHLDKNECVYKLSSSVKTNKGEVKNSSITFLLLKIPTLKIKMKYKKDVFEANLKSECDLWHLMVKEMCAGKKMADDHKVWGLPMMVPKTTTETLKHKINPSAGETFPQAVEVLLYTPGQLESTEKLGDAHPKLWCALNGGKVVVFDASSWSLQHSFKVGSSKLKCMIMAEQSQVWIGSADSVIYLINTHSMSCNKQLNDHRFEIVDIVVDNRESLPSEAYSCSVDGTVIAWNISTLKVNRRFQLPYETRDEAWASWSGSSELLIWNMEDFSTPLQKLRLSDCSEITCAIKVKNQ
ncbi:hypothetical protein Chor_002584, partial [Crotalus horridus]